MGPTLRTARPGSLCASAEKEGGRAGSSPNPLAHPRWGGRPRYLLLAQGQVQKRPATQRQRVLGLSPQHGVEVEHGRLLLAQERVTAGTGEQGLRRLTPWRKGVWHWDVTAAGPRWVWCICPHAAFEATSGSSQTSQETALEGSWGSPGGSGRGKQGLQP